MRITLILIFSFSFLALSAQRNIAIKNRYAKGSIVFTNGEILDCEIGFPILNRSMNLGLTVRSKNKITVIDMVGEKQKIDIDEIDYLEFEGKQGYYRMKVMHSLTMKRKGKVKQSKYKSWYIQEEFCDEFQSFVRADKFDLDKEGQPYAIHVDSLGEYLLQRPGEKWPTLIWTAISYTGLNKKQFWKLRRNAFAQYMDSDEHAQNFLKGKKRLNAKELEDYIQERCN